MTARISAWLFAVSLGITPLLCQAEPFTGVKILNNGATVVDIDQTSSPTSSSFGSHPQDLGVAFGNAYADTTGFVSSSSTIENFGGGGGVAVASFGAFSSAPNGDPMPLGSYQVTSTTIYAGTYQITETANYRFGFHVLNQTLVVDDPSSGAYARLGTQILFNGQVLYETLASLTNDAMGDPAFESTFNNPTGAALPSFQSFDPEDWFAPAYDAFIDLGTLTAGTQLDVEYRAFTEVFSPEVITGGGGGQYETFGFSEEGFDDQYVHARFGDPFDLEANNTDPRLLQASEVPEPTSLLLFGLCAGALGCWSAALRRRP